METQTNLRISIPKPCHEDWNKFTPDEKGAFCKVCSKSVHDFTKKSTEEIQTILVEEISAGNKVCGRFNEDQLTPSAEMPEMNLYALNFTRIKKFAMAIFLVFGGYLFNATRAMAQKEIMGKMKYVEPVRGEIAIRRPLTPVKDTAVTRADSSKALPIVPKCNAMKGDVQVETIQKLSIMGGVSARPVEPPPVTVKGNAIVQPMVVGQAVIETPPVSAVDPVPTIEDIIDANIPQEIADTIGAVDSAEVTEEPIMGLIAMPYDTADMNVIPLVLTNDIEQDVDGEFAAPESTFVKIEDPSEIISSEINIPSLECFPNPSAGGIITLRYSLKMDGMASISIFDMKGNLVKTLLPAQSLYASSYETKYDVSDLDDGIYFFELVSGNNKTTTKIVISN